MRLIDADKLIMYVADCKLSESITWEEAELLTDFILNSPTIESRPKGEWLFENDGYTDLFKCSNCGDEWAMWFDDKTPQEQGYNYCPMCGAYMRSEE